MSRKKKRVWSDASILKTIPNPSNQDYCINHTNPEVVFLGVPNQPDIAKVRIKFWPRDTVIELKSLKFYFHQFRNVVISYERLMNVVYTDLMKTYNPRRLKIKSVFNPRGGIRSRIVIDSEKRKNRRTKPIRQMS